MTAVLQRLMTTSNELKTLIERMPKQPARGVKWRFIDQALSRNEVVASAVFLPLIANHALLNLEYAVLCNRLRKDFIAKADEQKYRKELTEQLIAALAMAELLTHLYRSYLNVPREVLRLQKEQRVFRRLLRRTGFEFHKKQWDEIKSFSPTQLVRGKTALLNWPRLFSNRLRRFFITLGQFSKQMKGYNSLINFVDQFANPVLSHVAWLFYIPRLAVNLMLLGKHLFAPNTHEKQLDWWERLSAQWSRRWFEVANDSVWLIAGVLACFILTGTLAPVGTYITVALFAFDVFLAGWRAYGELSRLKTLIEEYETSLATRLGAGEPKGNLGDLQSHISALKERESFEKKRLLQSVVTTSALLLTICTIIPALALLNPLIPFIGALFLVLITAASYFYTQWLETKRPVDKVMDLPEKKSNFSGVHTLFKPAKGQKDEALAIENSLSAPFLQN